MNFKKNQLYLPAILLTVSLLLTLMVNNTSVITENNSEDSMSTSFSGDLVKAPVDGKGIIDILDLKTFRFASIDGKLRADDEHNLILDRELRHWLDFYLSALGELTLDQVIALMAKEINQLPSPAKEQAHALLTRYLDYKGALSAYDERESLAIGEVDNVKQLQNRFDWQTRLRRQYLSQDVVDSFWQLDEIIDHYALQKLVIRNSELSDNDKKQALIELENQLPSDLSSFKKDVYIASNLLEKEQALSGEDNTETIRQLRIDEVGIDAANRLDELDVAQSLWRNKLLAFRTVQATLLSAKGLSEEDKKTQLIEYKQKFFTDKEQLRLPVALKILNSEE